MQSTKEEVVYVGNRHQRLVGQRWDPPTGQELAGTALLLHGGGQTRHSWGGTAARLAQRGWVAIAVDARGHGDSQWAQDGDYSLDAFVEDLYAIEDTLDEPAVVIGASLGGMTALLAQGERPKSGRALVLVDIAPDIQRAGRDRIRTFMTSGAGGFNTLEDVAEAIQAYNPRRPQSASTDGIKKNVRMQDDGRWHWHWDPKVLQMGGDRPRTVSTERLYQAARKVTVPTLVVRGSRSDIVTPEAAAELLQLIPTATSVEVAAGHMIAGDNNDVFGTHLLDFLDDLPDRTDRREMRKERSRE